MTMSGAVLPFPSFPSSQVNVADLAAARFPERQTVVLRLLLLPSSSPLVPTVNVVVIEAVVVVATAAAVVAVVVKPTITRVGVVGATVVKAVPSSSP
jgi:hypothetical protein